MAEFRDKNNLNIVHKTEQPDSTDFSRWFFWQLGKSGFNFEGELGYRRCLKKLINRQPDNEDFQIALRKCEQRIRLMRALISKGWITPPLKRQPLDNAEEAWLDYLQRVFVLQWRECGQWDKIRPQMKVIKQYIMETYYE